MPSFQDCMTQQLAKARVPRRKVNAALRKFEAKRDNYIAEGMDPVAAEARAADEAAQAAIIEIKAAERRSTAQALTTIKLSSVFERSDINLSAGERLKALVSPRAGAPIQSYESLRDVVRGQLQSRMSDLIEKYSPKYSGLFRSEKGLLDIIDELYGVDTGNAEAKAFSRAWTETADLSVDLFRQAGGSLLKRADWLIPQRQSIAKMLKTGKATWTARHLDLLDWTRVRRPDGSLVPSAEREKFLSDVFDTMSKSGANKLLPGNAGKKALGNELDMARVLIYKDAASWKAMHSEFGDGNVFDVMISHVEDRAHRIAMMKVFGPNPLTGAAMAKAFAIKKAADDDIRSPRAGRTRKSKADDDAKVFEDMFERAVRSNRTDPENLLAAGAATSRNMLTSAMLGSAAFVAIPGDFANAAHVRAFSRMPVTRSIGRYLRMWKPGVSSDRAMARRAGFVHESAVSFHSGAERFSTLAAVGPKWSRRVADVVLRASLLTPHTQFMRFTTQLETLGMFAEHAGSKFDDLPFVERLKQADISARDWDEIRALPLWEPEPGVTFMRPADVFKHMGTTRRAYELHDKFALFAVNMTKLMVPEANIESSTVLRGGTRSGTVSGEVMNSLAMFKSFPVTFTQMHHRLALLQASKAGYAGYVTALVIAMTTAGAMATQMRQIADGKDPLPMNDLSFLGTALLRGGGFGVYGDLLFGGVNKYGNGLADIAAGPIITKLGDFRDLTFGNMVEAINGEETNALPEAIRMAKTTLPGTSLWFAKALLSRMVFEQMEQAADPRAFYRYRKQIREEQERGGDFFFAPGTTSPQRAPELF